jgi:hypothetical protein
MVSWVQGTLLHDIQNETPPYDYLEGTHNGYHRLKKPVGYRRGILQLQNDIWLVVDRIDSSVPHTYRLHWLFDDFPYTYDDKLHKVILHTGKGDYRMFSGLLEGTGESSLIRADENYPRGWQSRYYYHKEPALSFDLVTEHSTATFYTILGPGINDVQIEKDTINIFSDSHSVQVRLNPSPKNVPLVKDVLYV